jgi:hypothetical protein
MATKNQTLATPQELAVLEDRLQALAERYQETCNALRTAAEQIRVIRETSEFFDEKGEALGSITNPALRQAVNALLAGAQKG